MTRFRALAALLLLVLLAACAAGPSTPSATEESWLLPGGPGPDGNAAMLKAHVFFPPGAGPFPAAVINHGSPGEPGRQFMAMPSYPAAARWFLDRGYMVVVPQRRGYGDTGPWPENPGPCQNPDFIAAGNAAADDIIAVVRHIRRLQVVRPDRVLLVGQSAGGFGVAAATSRNPAGVFAAINIAGGRLGGQNEARCAPDRLVAANGIFGQTAKVPSLWLYTENDSYFDPVLSNRMVSAYGDAGGRAVYILLPPFKDDGHKMFEDPDGVPMWSPYVSTFLGALE